MKEIIKLDVNQWNTKRRVSILFDTPYWAEIVQSVRAKDKNHIHNSHILYEQFRDKVEDPLLLLSKLIQGEIVWTYIINSNSYL